MFKINTESVYIKEVKINEPSREIMAHFVLRKLTLQTRMRSYPCVRTAKARSARCVISGRTLLLFPYFMCADSEGLRRSPI